MPNDVKIVSNLNAQAVFANSLFYKKGNYDDVTSPRVEPAKFANYTIYKHDGRPYFEIAHDRNTFDVSVQVMEVLSDGSLEVVYTGIEYTPNSVKLLFDTYALGSDYKVILGFK